MNSSQPCAALAYMALISSSFSSPATQLLQKLTHCWEISSLAITLLKLGVLKLSSSQIELSFFTSYTRDLAAQHALRWVLAKREGVDLFPIQSHYSQSVEVTRYGRVAVYTLNAKPDYIGYSLANSYQLISRSNCNRGQSPSLSQMRFF